MTLDQTDPFGGYSPQSQSFYDEMFEAAGHPRSACEPLVKSLRHLGMESLERRQLAAEEALLKAGITFTLHGGRASKARYVYRGYLFPRAPSSRVRSRGQ